MTKSTTRHNNSAIPLLTIIVIALLIGAYARNITWKDEVALWNDVVTKSPYKARGYACLALYGYLKQDHVDEAIASLRTAIGIQPDYGDAHAALGSAYLRKGRVQDAIGELETALRYNFNLPVVHSQLASAYAETGQQEKAVQHFRYSATLDPSAVNYYNYALSLQNVNRIPEAIPFYKMALDADPGYLHAALNMANAFDILGRDKDALKYYLYSLKLNPRSGGVYYNLGLYYERAKKFAMAEDAYQKALSLEPALADKYPELKKFRH